MNFGGDKKLSVADLRSVIKYRRTAKGGFMSFETISSVIAAPAALLSAFIAVFNIIIKVNRTLCSLEIAVKQLKEYIEKQSEKNGDFYDTLEDHELRISKLEYQHQDTKNDPQKK